MSDDDQRFELPRGKNKRDQNRVDANKPRDRSKTENEILDSLDLGDDDDED